LKSNLEYQEEITLNHRHFVQNAVCLMLLFKLSLEKAYQEEHIWMTYLFPLAPEYVEENSEEYIEMHDIQRASSKMCLHIMQFFSNHLNDVRFVPGIFEKIAHEIAEAELESMYGRSFVGRWTATTLTPLTTLMKPYLKKKTTFADKSFEYTLQYLFLFKTIDGMMGRTDIVDAEPYLLNQRENLYENVFIPFYLCVALLHGVTFQMRTILPNGKMFTSKDLPNFGARAYNALILKGWSIPKLAGTKIGAVFCSAFVYYVKDMFIERNQIKRAEFRTVAGRIDPQLFTKKKNRKKMQMWPIFHRDPHKQTLYEQILEKYWPELYPILDDFKKGIPVISNAVSYATRPLYFLQPSYRGLINLVLQFFEQLLSFCQREPSSTLFIFVCLIVLKFKSVSRFLRRT
jgi:hypothetical protein